MNFDSISSRRHETLYSSDYAGSSPRLKKTRALPKNVVAALERGELDEAMKRLQLQKDKSRFFSKNPKLKKTLEVILAPLTIPSKSFLQLAKRQQHRNTIVFNHILEKQSSREIETKRQVKLIHQAEVVHPEKERKTTVLQKRMSQLTAFPIQIAIQLKKNYQLLLNKSLAVSAVVGGWVVQRFKAIHNVLMSYFEKEKKRISERLSPIFSAIHNRFLENKKYCEKFLEKRFDFFKRGCQRGIATINNFTAKSTELVLAFFQPTLERINSHLNKEKERVADAIRKKKQKVENFVQNTWQVVSQVVPSIGLFFQKVFFRINEKKTIKQGKKLLGRFKKLGETIIKKSLSKWNTAKNMIVHFSEAVARTIIILLSILMKGIKKLFLFFSLLFMWLWKNFVKILSHIKRWGIKKLQDFIIYLERKIYTS